MISLVKLVLVVALESAFIVKFLISTTPTVLTAKERTLQMKFKDAQTSPKEQSLHFKHPTIAIQVKIQINPLVVAVDNANQVVINNQRNPKQVVKVRISKILIVQINI